MPTNVVFNGSTYSVPNYGDSGWAQGAGNLSLYLQAIASGTLQTTGGTFTLSADTNFGASFGLIAAYYKSLASNIATSGVLRLAIGDTIDWGTANNALSVSGTALRWNASTVLTVANVAANIVEEREVYIAGTPLNNYTGSLTVFNMVGAYVANGVNLQVFINGLVQDVTYDYTETSTTAVTFGANLNTGDRVSLRWVVY